MFWAQVCAHNTLQVLSKLQNKVQLKSLIKHQDPNTAKASRKLERFIWEISVSGWESYAQPKNNNHLLEALSQKRGHFVKFYKIPTDIHIPSATLSEIFI